jgi:FkbM family methyltransferase
MRKILNRVVQSKAVQIAVKSLGILPLINLGLRVSGVTRQIPGSDIRYRLRFIDSVALMDGLLNGGEYAAIESEAAAIHSIIDLGCNVGFFPLYLCKLRGDKNVRGILVDANPAAAEEAANNLKLNGLDQLTAIHGLAGGDDGSDKGEFFVTQNSMSSTANSELIGTKLGVSRLVVPLVRVEQEFTRRFGADAPVDLLKVDIEGSELVFLSANKPLLNRCARIILEYHLPMVTFAAVESALCPLGYVCRQNTYEAGSPWGVAYFVREPLGSAAPSNQID